VECEVKSELLVRLTCVCIGSLLYRETTRRNYVCNNIILIECWT